MSQIALLNMKKQEAYSMAFAGFVILTR